MVTDWHQPNLTQAQGVLSLPLDSSTRRQPRIPLGFAMDQSAHCWMIALKLGRLEGLSWASIATLISDIMITGRGGSNESQ